MTEEDRKAKMLERVRALLAKADDRSVTPAEADAFRAKADQLMTAYAIDQWEVRAAQDGVNMREQLEQKVIDFGWYANNSRAQELWSLFNAVADHCRIVVATRAWNSGAEQRGMTVIGLPSDIDYFDMLFTHLMLQMAKGLEPKPDPKRSMIDNLVTMKEAGMKWQRIHELLVRAGQMPEKPWERSIGITFTKKYSDYCRDNGREQLRVVPSVFQRSFAMGFVSEVRERMVRMRKHSQTDDDGSLLPAVRDIKEKAQSLYDELFPPNARHEGRSVSRNLATDMGAYMTGKRAGERADIANASGRRVGGRRELTQ